MKIHFLAFIAALFAFVAGEVFEELRANVSSPVFQNDTVKVAAFDNPADQQLWQKSICRGQRLFLAMTFDLPEAGRICQPIISPWDGTLERELTTWGYSDISGDIEHEFDCDMSPDKNGIEDMLEEINANPNDSRHGGDNICHALQHRDGTVVERDEIGNLPDEEDQYYNVNGREYRVSYYICGRILPCQPADLFPDHRRILRDWRKPACWHHLFSQPRISRGCCSWPLVGAFCQSRRNACAQIELGYSVGTLE